ncbi:MAG: CYTH domain-containing protein [Desulfobacterales bacterium]
MERKFQITSDELRLQAKGSSCRQGYLNLDKDRTVRVRTIDEMGFITIKGISKGAVRDEFEYEIPLADADALLSTLCHQPIIEKTRYRIAYEGFTWEVDAFAGANQGLIIAEIELEQEDQSFEKPAWIGDEVTGVSKYYNVNLVARPFSKWEKPG